MTEDDASNDQANGNEIAQRRDEVVKRMLATPPQPRVSPTKKKPDGKGFAEAKPPKD